MERSHASDSMKRSYRTKWVRFRQFSSFPQGGRHGCRQTVISAKPVPPRRRAGIHPAKASRMAGAAGTTIPASAEMTVALGLRQQAADLKNGGPRTMPRSDKMGAASRILNRNEWFSLDTLHFKSDRRLLCIRGRLQPCQNVAGGVTALAAEVRWLKPGPMWSLPAARLKPCPDTKRSARKALGLSEQYWI